MRDFFEAGFDTGFFDTDFAEMDSLEMDFFGATFVGRFVVAELSAAALFVAATPPRPAFFDADGREVARVVDDEPCNALSAVAFAERSFSRFFRSTFEITPRCLDAMR